MSLIISQAHKAIVAPPTPGVLNLFPTFPRLRDGKVVIPHGQRETLLLRHMGYQVPSPLMYYDWPGNKRPYKVQVATVHDMVDNPRFYNLNGMGTGKTRCVLWWWDFLNRGGLVGKLLVVAPLSTLSLVWAKEAFATLPGRTVQVLHGTRSQRLQALAADADIYVINHDGLRTIVEALAKRSDITALALDELAVYRNNSDRSKMMRKFAQRFQAIVGLTGTPMPNEPTDVWGQAKIITPHTVPMHQRGARELLMFQVSQYIWRPKPDAIINAFKMLRPSCRYSLDDVIELPPLINRSVDVELSKEQIETYNRVRLHMVAAIQNKQIEALNAGAMLNKLVQIGGGWVYTKRPEFVALDSKTRVQALIDLITSADHKVLVAIPYRHMIEGISEIFNSTAVGIDHCVVHGDVTKVNRDHIFNLFQQTDKYRVMLAHPETVHHGLTLTAADNVIWYVPIASLDVYQQFNARITRIGQKHKQQVIRMCGTPTEKKLYSMLDGKDTRQQTLLELLEEATGEAI